MSDLLDKLIQFCKDHEYTYEFKDNNYYGLPFRNEWYDLERGCEGLYEFYL